MNEDDIIEGAAENILQPLGMVHTRFYDDHTLVLDGFRKLLEDRC